MASTLFARGQPQAQSTSDNKNSPDELLKQWEINVAAFCLYVYRRFYLYLENKWIENGKNKKYKDSFKNTVISMFPNKLSGPSYFNFIKIMQDIINRSNINVEESEKNAEELNKIMAQLISLVADDAIRNGIIINIDNPIIEIWHQEKGFLKTSKPSRGKKEDREDRQKLIDSFSQFERRMKVIAFWNKKLCVNDIEDFVACFEKIRAAKIGIKARLLVTLNFLTHFWRVAAQRARLSDDQFIVSINSNPGKNFFYYELGLSIKYILNLNKDHFAHLDPRKNWKIPAYDILNTLSVPNNIVIEDGEFSLESAVKLLGRIRIELADRCAEQKIEQWSRDIHEACNNLNIEYISNFVACDEYMNQVMEGCENYLRKNSPSNFRVTCSYIASEFNYFLLFEKQNNPQSAMIHEIERWIAEIKSIGRVQSGAPVRGCRF